MSRFSTFLCPRRGLLALGVAASLSAQAAEPVVAAAGGETAPVQLDAVQVSGQHLSIRQAIGAKREAAVVSDGVAADDIGSIPTSAWARRCSACPACRWWSTTAAAKRSS